LAIHLAKKYNGEVISADSMQIYREMSIGTAKPTPQEMDGVPHHLVDCVSVSEEYSVARYVAEASTVIEEVFRRGKLPILSGGTGLYVNSLVDHLQFSESPKDDALRRELQRRMETEGAQALLEELATFDPEAAAALHPNNQGRIIRAIEVYRTSGMTITEQNRRSREIPSPYALCMIGINFEDRQRLYDRIDLRVDQMMEQGLLQETKEFFARENGSTAVQAIGYKELAPYLRGEMALEEAVENLKRETRRYAKRQLTWFRRDVRVQWCYRDAVPEKVFLQNIEKIVEESGILCYTDKR
jgi:tRNA dimethylallyltransferase